MQAVQQVKYIYFFSLQCFYLLLIESQADLYEMNIITEKKLIRISEKKIFIDN